jgi:Lrp/AsnC family leucine-responsive transcriptional regulator
VGLTPAPTLERVRKLERLGYIRGYVALLDEVRVGCGFTVLVSVALTAHQLQEIDAFRAAVQRLPEILECYHVTGEGDFLLKVVVADASAYQQLVLEHLCRLPGVQKIQSSVVLSTIKRETRLPVSDQGAPA